MTELNVFFEAPELDVSFEAPSATITPELTVIRDYIDIDPFTGPYTVTPSEEQQILETNGLRMTDDVTVEAVETGSATTPETTITATPVISVSAGGLITASVSKTESVTPSVSPGYVEEGTAGDVHVTGSATEQLSTQAAKTVTPSTSEQTAVAAGKFTTGAVKVAKIPPEYIIPSGKKTITENGSDIDVTAFAAVDVSVPTPTPALQTKSVTYTPSGSQQTDTITPDDGYDGLDEVDVTINATPAATPASASSVTLNPILSVDYSTGEITATNSGSASVNPISAAGYATPSLSHQVNISGNAATQLYTLGATTYTPTKTGPQTIAAGRLLTGDQTIAAIPEQYYDMSGPMSWLGKDATAVVSDFYSKVDTLKNTAWNGWTPSTNAQVCVESVTLSDAKFTATSMDLYDYYIIWECGVDVVYTGSPTLKALPQLARAYIVQQLTRRPSSWANIQAANFNTNVTAGLYTSSFLRYYGTTTGSSTFTWAASYGLYFGQTAPTLSSTTAASPTITPKTPTLSARCSTTYMSTTSAAAVDAEESHWWIKGSKVYRVKKDGILAGCYKGVVGAINATPPYST